MHQSAPKLELGHSEPSAIGDSRSCLPCEENVGRAGASRPQRDDDLFSQAKSSTKQDLPYSALARLVPDQNVASLRLASSS